MVTYNQENTLFQYVESSGSYQILVLAIFGTCSKHLH